MSLPPSKPDLAEKLAALRILLAERLELYRKFMETDPLLEALAATHREPSGNPGELPGDRATLDDRVAVAMGQAMGPERQGIEPTIEQGMPAMVPPLGRAEYTPSLDPFRIPYGAATLDHAPCATLDGHFDGAAKTAQRDQYVLTSDEQEALSRILRRSVRVLREPTPDLALICAELGLSPGEDVGAVVAAIRGLRDRAVAEEREAWRGKVAAELETAYAGMRSNPRGYFWHAAHAHAAAVLRRVEVWNEAPSGEME